MTILIRLLDAWIALADRIALVAVRAAGGLILAAAVLIGVEVLLRRFLGISLGGADELSGYAFVIGTTWALAFTLLRRANVRVDAVYSRLPSSVTGWLDLAGLVSLIAFVGYVGWRGIAVLEDSLTFATRATTPLATPQWLPQSLWLAGFALFLFAALPLALRVFLALVSGDRQRAAQLAGARSLQEDAAEEAAIVRVPQAVTVTGER